MTRFWRSSLREKEDISDGVRRRRRKDERSRRETEFLASDFAKWQQFRSNLSERPTRRVQPKQRLGVHVRPKPQCKGVGGRVRSATEEDVGVRVLFENLKDALDERFSLAGTGGTVEE